jgi:hypothetical protein
MADIYTYLTYSAARQQLANRLYDPTKQFWSDAELKSILLESLRTWNALTSFWRGDFTFPTQTGVSYYDLTDGTNLPNTLRPLTITDAALYLDIQYALLEPSVGVNPWTGVSTQFTANDLLNAVQRRRNEILSITGCTTTRRLVPAVNGRIALADTVIDVRRMAYLPAVDPPSTMWPEDTWGEQSFEQGYLQLPAGTPLTYLLSTQPPISFDTNRPPGGGGQYELLTVESRTEPSIVTPSLLTVPDDWTHLIKWGALADLLSRESNAKDPTRAQYCNQRYLMGAALLSKAPALLSLRIANTPLQIASMRDADLYRASWQAEAQKQPDTALHSGLNLIALVSAPDAGPYSVTATVVRNAPVPTADADNLQVSREDLDAILDYAQHVAAFKQGGAEFLSTIPLLERFLKRGAFYNSKLAELGEFTAPLFGLSQLQEQRAPRMVPAEETAT